MVKSGVFGVHNTINDKFSSKKVHDKADDIARSSIYEIGRKASQTAPVDTGRMRDSLVSAIRRTPSVPKGMWEMPQTVPYTLVQEFEHKTKSRFIYNAVEDIRPFVWAKVNSEFKGGAE